MKFALNPSFNRLLYTLYFISLYPLNQVNLYKKEKILSFFTIRAITCAIYKPIYAKSDISVFVFLVKFLSEILEITAENGISYTLHQFVKIGYVVKA